MNEWVKNSFDLAASRGYLDKLSKVYPVNSAVNREIDAKEKEKIHKAFSSKNPKTIKRIGNRLFHLGYEGILSGVGKPKSPSRQMGQMFKNWLPNLGYPILAEEKFLEYDGIGILKGGDESLMRFAKNKIDYRRKKGLDLVLKTGKNFVLGEAKLITTNGGTQDKSFREAISFVKTKNKNAVNIAILDGVIWLPSNNKKKKNLYDTLRDLNENQIVLSSLLLKDFIEAL